MRDFKIALLIFLIGLILAPLALAQANDSSDVISLVEEAQEDLKEYTAKRNLQKDISFRDRQIKSLKGDNAALRVEERGLQRELDSIGGKIDKLGQMEGDLILKLVALFFSFSLAGFLSSLLFIRIVWRVKIRGVKR